MFIKIRRHALSIEIWIIFDYLNKKYWLNNERCTNAPSTSSRTIINLRRVRKESVWQRRSFQVINDLMAPFTNGKQLLVAGQNIVIPTKSPNPRIHDLHICHISFPINPERNENNNTDYISMECSGSVTLDSCAKSPGTLYFFSLSLVESQLRRNWRSLQNKSSCLDEQPYLCLNDLVTWHKLFDTQIYSKCF